MTPITPTPIPTLTPSPTPSEIPKRLIDLELQLFHDYHGDGAKQSDEPVITDAVLNVIDDKGNKVLTGIKGNGNGIYRIEDLKDGRRYRLDFSNETRNKYRHIAISNDKFYITGNYEFIADTNKIKLELGLMNGYLTLPFKKGVSYFIRYYFDVGNGRGWKGKPSYLSHTGTDFWLQESTKLLATAPGRITKIDKLEWVGNYVIMDFSNGFRASYCHIKEPLVSEGQKVRRGDVVALSGKTGTIEPHLHFQLMSIAGGPWGYALDPFGDVSAWTKDNDPKYPLPNM
jgi:murein DD-endopeptidase MepM/ murein hydrolase activator NlpD